MSDNIESAIKQICEEKGLSYEAVIETIESAMAAAYRKDFGDKKMNIEVTFDPSNGRIEVFDVKTVVAEVDLEEVEKTEEKRREAQELRNAEIAQMEEAGEEVPEELRDPVEVEGPTFNEKTEMMLPQAKNVRDDVKIGEVLRMQMPVPGEFGRMAAMTAKQVVMQKLREAEREVIFGEYKDTEGTCIYGNIGRRQGRMLFVDLGRATALLRAEDQVPGERYAPGERFRFYVRSVSLGSRGPEILLSRTNVELVRCLFEDEIPEIGDATVQIKGIAREPGNRTKVAVFTQDDSIDPIGACIGQRGTRIQTIIAELGGEKVDIVHWSEDVDEYVAGALSPAKVSSVEIKTNDEGEEEAVVVVEEDQLSLAVGRGGQNVRLASRLTGIRINVQGAHSDPSNASASENGDNADNNEEADEVADETTEEVVAEVTGTTEGTEEEAVVAVAEPETKEVSEEAEESSEE